MHKADQDKVLNQARYAEMQWRNRKDEDEIREYLEDDIVPWLDQHIKAMDVPMADFIFKNNNETDKNNINTFIISSVVNIYLL